MSTTEAPSSSGDSHIKRQLLWQKVKDSPATQPTERATLPPQKQKIVYRGGGIGVPLIPDDLIAAGGQQADGTTTKIYRNLTSNPFIPIGMVLTVGCLVGMCKATLNRNSMRAQYYMRGRLAAQGFTVAAILVGALWFGAGPSGYAQPGELPKFSPTANSPAYVIKNSE